MTLINWMLIILCCIILTVILSKENIVIYDSFPETVTTQSLENPIQFKSKILSNLKNLQKDLDVNTFKNLSALTQKNIHYAESEQHGGQNSFTSQEAPLTQFTNLFQPHVYKNLADYENNIAVNINNGLWKNKLTIKDNLDLTPEVLKKKVYVENKPDSMAYNNFKNKPYYMRAQVVYDPANNTVVPQNSVINEKTAYFESEQVNLNDFFKANQNMFSEQLTTIPLVTSWKQNVQYLNIPMISNEYYGLPNRVDISSVKSNVNSDKL